MKNAILAGLAFVALPAWATIHEVPLMRAAGGFQQGFVRVEAFEQGGDVRIEAWDDSGLHAETTLSIDAGEIQGFNSNDLELGNAAKGMPEGIGSPSVGDWRLKLSADFGFDVNAYVRTRDGFVTQLDSTLQATSVAVAEISFFNPASNYNQRSWLRIINDEDEAAGVAVRGTDDRGVAGRGTFRIRVLPLHAVSVTASDLEGVFGDGSGKWRLEVSSNRPLTIVNLLETPTGHLSSLEPQGAPECSASSDFRGYQLPYGAGIDERERRGYDGSDPNLSLRNSVWRYEDLARANFAGANLGGARFFRSNLRFADLSGAYLGGAGFQVADLTGADLNSADLSRADFSFASMVGVNLSGVIDAASTKFNGALLCNSDLSSVNMDRASFKGASLAGSNGGRSTFDGARFARANMSSMYLHGATFEGANFHNVNLAESDLTDTDFEGADLWGASLAGARLSESNFERANLSWSDLSHVVAVEADFQSANLSTAQAYRADFRDSDFTKSNLQWVFFVQAKLQGADFREADLEGANLNGADLSNADLRDADLRGVDFCESRIEGIRLDGARIDNAQCLPEP